MWSEAMMAVPSGFVTLLQMSLMRSPVSGQDVSRKPYFALLDRLAVALSVSLSLLGTSFWNT
jgi:hypothetical protein